MKLFNKRKEVAERHPDFYAFVLRNLWRAWKSGDEIRVQIVSGEKVEEEAALCFQPEDIKMIEELKRSL